MPLFEPNPLQVGLLSKRDNSCHSLNLPFQIYSAITQLSERIPLQAFVGLKARASLIDTGTNPGRSEPGLLLLVADHSAAQPVNPTLLPLLSLSSLAVPLGVLSLISL